VLRTFPSVLKAVLTYNFPLFLELILLVILVARGNASFGFFFLHQNYPHQHFILAITLIFFFFYFNILSETIQGLIDPKPFLFVSSFPHPPSDLIE
jgi:hypothetical protein